MDDLQKQRAGELHDQGLGRNAIARELGVAGAVITKWASREGRTFDRSQTAVGVRAKIIDAASRRQHLTGRIYDMLERTLDRAEYAPAGGWTTIIRDKGGAEQVVSIDELPLRDLRDLGATVNTLSYAIGALERANALYQGQDALDGSISMLGRLAHAIGVETQPQTTESAV